MSKAGELIKLLFPKSTLWQFNKDSNLKKLIDGIASVPDDMSTDAQRVYLDLFPETTRFVDEWESAFQIRFTNLLSDRQKRAVLEALWAMRNGSATAEFIQNLLRMFIPGICIVENTPVAMPRKFASVYASVNGNRYMVNGYKKAINGRRMGDQDFVPTILKTNREEEFFMPENPRHWETCFYVCGAVHRNRYQKITHVEKITVDRKWREFIDFIILKIKPLHMTAVMFIEYV